MSTSSQRAYIVAIAAVAAALWYHRYRRTQPPLPPVPLNIGFVNMPKSARAAVESGQWSQLSQWGLHSTEARPVVGGAYFGGYGPTNY